VEKDQERDILGTTVGMAVEQKSIHSLQQIVSNTPKEGTFWYHLDKVDIDWLELINSSLLTDPVLDTIPKDRPYIFAIDFTDDPYYGKEVEVNEDFVVGGERKKSTNWFYRYASLYLINGDRKYTISVVPTKKNTTPVMYVKRLLDIVDSLGFMIEVLLLDRGFYGTELFNYLQKQEVPHIIPVKADGKVLKKKLKGRRARHFTYTMDGKDGKAELTIAVDVHYRKGKNDKHGVENIGFIVHNVHWKPRKVATVYRRRFSIEASYRMRNIVRPHTSTRKPMFRYLMALVSFLIKNVWVAIKWRLFCPVRRGPRRVDEEIFRFDQYCGWIGHVFRRRTKFVTSIRAYRRAG
jgi:Transposase DDE domain